MKYLIAVNDLLGTPLWLTDDLSEATMFESEKNAKKVISGLVLYENHVFTIEEQDEAIKRLAGYSQDKIDHLKNQFEKIQKQIQDPEFADAAIAAGKIIGDGFYQTLIDTADHIAKQIDEATKKQKQNVAWLKYYKEKKG